MLKQPATFLVEALRDGIAAMGEAPLAGALAAGVIGGDSSAMLVPPGFHPAQVEAYRACLGTGVQLVWGPPGTGKTTVLKRAISDLIAAGRRVLLVSATNIAVDNALLGVVKENRHGSGDIVRVGPPQLREVADDPRVSLPLMVRERLAQTTERRRGIEAELVAIRARTAELAAVGAQLIGFDPEGYAAAVALLGSPGRDVRSTAAKAADARAALVRARQDLHDAETAVHDATSQVAECEDSRRLWGKSDALRREQADVLRAAERKEAATLISEDRCSQLREQLLAAEGKGAVARWRMRQDRNRLREQLHEAEQQSTVERQEALCARATAETHSAAIDEQVMLLLADAAHTREQIAVLDADLGAAHEVRDRAGQRAAAARAGAEECEQAARSAREAAEVVAAAEARSWPALHDAAERLRPGVAADGRRRPGLEKQFQQVQQEFERLSRNAQGEIIKGARLVATTLARFRTNKAVFEGPYDVVLVDEAGAATLPEIILAAAKASRAVVLLGDFMQLGAVIPPAVKDSGRQDVKRWLLPDVFRHCGIVEPADAQRHPACVSLVEQHRFGPAVMRFVNALAYGGMLQGSSRVLAPRPPGDPEIVLVDTDGLHELALVHLTGASSGWWAAGPLISRALVELHREGGEETGIVTPYRMQADATLEALRDVEPEGRPLAEVGTAHRFQGREFPVVVFDTVESAWGRPMWMAQASAQPGARQWPRDGARLFNVAATRAQTRLYVIASRERIVSAQDGTALAHLKALTGTQGVRWLHAKHLITPPHTHDSALGEFGSALADVLSRHVEVTDIHDETAFYSAFEDQLRAAKASLWLWAPWVARRIRSLLPLLQDAVSRGVRLRVFIRDDTDQIQARPENQQLIADLRALAHTVVPVNVMHQKVVVIDERTVMLGSLNTLSQSWTRELMLTMHGAHFARKLLTELNAEIFSRPPKCGRCGSTSIELRRRRNRTWFWRCYDNTCKTTPNGRSDAWTRDIKLTR
ncbi:AAA domain-containing protein [Actinacidiphila rubida]|nr:AAA domain-containing protein [Actinacidiphila rubida]